MLRDMHDAARPSLPKFAPTGFIRERWARYVLPGGAIDRRYYELCVLSELRDRLRAGDVWVVDSRRYRSFEERLISHMDAGLSVGSAVRFGAGRAIPSAKAEWPLRGRKPSFHQSAAPGGTGASLSGIDLVVGRFANS
jgi:hypothetical protein